MSKHTPGPWKFEHHPGAGYELRARIPSLDRAAKFVEVLVRPRLEINEDGEVYAFIAYESWNQFPSEDWRAMQAANARLIAKSPEMFELLKGFIRGVDVVEITERADALVTEIEATS